MKRRNLLAAGSGALSVGAITALNPALVRAAAIWQPDELADGTIASSTLEALPGKVPLIKRSYRPPNFETPIEYFRTEFTPNDAFFVRWHLSGIAKVDARTWRLNVGGESAKAKNAYDLATLKRSFQQVEIAAVCLCSGNRRGMFIPHVPGIEWGVGAMGNARWKGVRLRDVLNKAGVDPKAKEVAFNGADVGALQATPDFIKSIPIERALDENTLIAFEMNGKPLPHWNGFPARIVVPGWTGTYWVKQVTDIDVRSEPQGGFWMNPAYRVPAGRFPAADRFVTQETQANVPITDIVISSLVTSPQDGQRYRIGQPVEVAGIAWDGGRGVRDVQVSMDAGRTWQPANLGPDYGRFAFRRFNYHFRAEKEGVMLVMVRAFNQRGDGQTMELVHNPSGYHHNVVQRLMIEVV